MLRSARPLGDIEGTILLAVPNDFTKQWIEDKAQSKLTTALSVHLGRTVRIAITVDPTLEVVTEEEEEEEPTPVAPAAPTVAQASSIPGVTWHGGVAEDTGLSDGAFDIVVFAQSWHWVDSELAGREAARILTLGGTLGIVWNQMDVSIPWVHRLTRIMRSGDVHRPDRPPTPGGGFTPMRLTQVTWEDIMTPEQILTLGTTRSSFIRASQAGRDRMQANLRWYLYEHLGYAPGENVAIPYTTLVWLGNVRPSEHLATACS